MEELSAAGNDEGAKSVAKSFAKFVDRIGKQKGPTNWPLQVWLAQANYAIAVQELPNKQEPGTPTMLSPMSKLYFTRARDGYQQLVKESVANPKLPPSKAALANAKMQLAESFRALGQYQEALDMFSEVLFERETSLEVQRAAALAFQERGQKDDPKWFAQAILGGYKLKTTGKNRVWGWQKISELAQGPGRKDTTFRDAFFEARLNIAKCRYLTAMKMDGDARRQELSRAEHDIQSIAILYPELGGEKWKPQFDELLKSIKREMTKAVEPAAPNNS
jgi:tetratricopeptide (TPR) repeat protein